jgi:hypothetical protein
MEESQWSQAKAVEWAKGLRHWPARRFRVEKSRAGNSRLVSLRVAHEMKDKYGGEIVELIEHAAIQLGRSMKKCKQCDAKAGARRRTMQVGRWQPTQAAQQARLQEGPRPQRAGEQELMFGKLAARESKWCAWRATARSPAWRR